MTYQVVKIFRNEEVRHPSADEVLILTVLNFRVPLNMGSF